MRVKSFFILLMFYLNPVWAESKPVQPSDKTIDYTTCAAFFAVLADGLRDKPQLNTKFTRYSELMMDHAISLPYDNYRGKNGDEMALEMKTEMQKSETNAKAVVSQHAIRCKGLLEGIVNKGIESGVN